MDIFLNKEKLTLIEFFKKHEKFKVFRHSEKKQDETLLYNVNNSNFQIICINNSYKGDIDKFEINPTKLQSLLEHIKKTHKHLEPEILHIVLGSFSYQKIVKNNHTIITTNIDWQQHLLPLFANLKNLKTEKEINIGNMSSQEFNSSIAESGSQLNQKLRDIQTKLRPSNLILLWVMMILFIIVPIFLYFLRGPLGFANATGAVFQLLMGGVNRDFLLGLNQWWRLFTYPFANANLFSLLIFGVMLYYICKVLEISLKPWKTVVTIFFGTPLAIFLLAVAMPNEVFSGIAPLVVMLYGLLLYTHHKEKNLTAIVAKSTTIMVPILLVLIPLFTSDYALYLVYFVAFITGILFGILVNYDFKSPDWTLIFPIVIFGMLFVTPFVLLYTNQYWPPNNFNVFDTLQYYYNSKLMSKGAIVKVLTNYYHIPNPGSYINF